MLKFEESLRNATSELLFNICFLFIAIFMLYLSIHDATRIQRTESPIIVSSFAILMIMIFMGIRLFQIRKIEIIGSEVIFSNLLTSYRQEVTELMSYEILLPPYLRCIKSKHSLYIFRSGGWLFENKVTIHDFDRFISNIKETNADFIVKVK